MTQSKSETKFGLKFDAPDPEHWVFGSSAIPCQVFQEDGDWTPFLPVKEYQNLNNVEPYACVTFTLLNCIETLIKRIYGEDRNYSDRFLAAISGTKVGGNSPQVVCEFLRKSGVVPQDLWPFDETIKTFEKFYEPFPESLMALAEEFVNEWEFNHDFVIPTLPEIQKALKCSPLMISVFAWVKDQNNLYYNPGMMDNHATTLVKIVPDACKVVFDSYDTAIKNLKLSDVPTIVKRFYIKKRTASIKKNWVIELFNSFISFFKDIWHK